MPQGTNTVVHGLTEQIPQVVTLTTPRRIVTPAMRGSKASAMGESLPVRTAASIWEVAGQGYEIVTVVPAHYFGYEEVWLGESRVRILDRERALLDCFALERAGTDSSLIEPLRALPIQGIRLLDPTKPPRGERNTRWGLRENLGARDAS